MKHIHKVRNVIPDEEIVYSVLTKDEIVERAKQGLVQALTASIWKNATITETRDNNRNLTTLEARVVIMPEHEYMEIMKKLNALREIVLGHTGVKKHG